MPVSKYRLKGHESFILREGWLVKGLKAVAGDPRLFSVASGADALGVGTNMAKSIRYWMRTALMMDESSTHGAFLTDFGKILLDYDPYLEDINSLWFIHANIVRNYSAATSWNVFFNRLGASSFRRDELFPMMMERLLESTGEETLSERSVRDDCSAILSMYLVEKKEGKDPEEKKESPFRQLGLLYPEGRECEFRRPDMSRIDPMVVLFLLSSAFATQTDNANVRSILIDDIVDGENMPGKILRMNRLMVNDTLDRLSIMGYVTVNRTAGLDIVYEHKRLSPNDVVREYFERRSL